MATLTELYDRERVDPSSDIHRHLITLHDAVITLNAQTIVEIGTGAGRATIPLLLAATQTGGHVWSYDIRPAQHPEQLDTQPNFTFIVGDSLTLAATTPRPIDLLMIDSEHTYEQTLAELRSYAPLVRLGGHIYLHDTGPHTPGVAEALHQFIRDNPRLEWVDNPICYGLGKIEMTWQL